MVINSHMDVFYPISIMGTGGAIGNSLFFALSSYGLLLSEKNTHQTFAQYFIKRLRRIYPPIWTFVTLFIIPQAFYYYFASADKFRIIASEFNLYDPLAFLSLIFYPPPAFWFLDALMIYYLMGYFLIINFSIKRIAILSTILVVAYISMYLRISDFSSLVIEQELKFKLLFYFLIFLFGLVLASLGDRVKYRGKGDFLYLTLFASIIYGHKILVIVTGGQFSEFQFVQQLSIFPLVFFFLKIGRSRFVIDFMNQDSTQSKFIGLISAMTLELYIVHGSIRVLISPHLSVFPINIVVYLLTIFMFAYLFYRINTFFIFHLTAKSY